ncbi:hypothetical protein PRIPAC_74662 [Pristionchus pacificus]|uniref:dihydrofolate reductase n=1 Tax=Pristionchus pacificus TaxID=54126 RepID=A0A2A6C9P0_PRIPA|nr:hypothetical protein PRIPAC_74662 [Pristionchus pacificus]|eukprot:PDM74894.1 hypothetical protein PRIPAC_40275 [Pristionchus pacificus]
MSLFRNLKLMTAIDSEGGIGKDCAVPWNLPTDLSWLEMSTLLTTEPNKRNAVIFGRRTYFSIPESNRPYKGRLNIVLSGSLTGEEQSTNDVVFVRNWAEIERTIAKFSHELENVWVLGGSEVYSYALDKDLVEEVRITEIQRDFACDVFFPRLEWRHRFTIAQTKRMNENGVDYSMNILLRR